MIGNYTDAVCIFNYLENPSIAAFLGAFTAFLLVVLTDWRRKRKNVMLLKYLVSDIADHASKRIEALQMNLDMLNEDGTVTPAEFMPFHTSNLQHVVLSVLDKLNANEKQAVDAILYWTPATDRQTEKLVALVKKSIEAHKRYGSSEKVEALLEEYRSDATYVIRNLEIIMKFGKAYVDGKPHEVIESYHAIK